MRNRLTERDLSRIVKRVINEDIENLQGTNWPLCSKVGVRQGSFEGEKDGFGFIRYDVDDQNKVKPVGTGGTPKMCKFNKRSIISL